MLQHLGHELDGTGCIPGFVRRAAGAPAAAFWPAPQAVDSTVDPAKRAPPGSARAPLREAFTCQRRRRAPALAAALADSTVLRPANNHPHANQHLPGPRPAQPATRAALAPRAAGASRKPGAGGGTACGGRATLRGQPVRHARGAAARGLARGRGGARKGHARAPPPR